MGMVPEEAIQREEVLDLARRLQRLCRLWLEQARGPP
jgi:hypothetical protein